MCCSGSYACEYRHKVKHGCFNFLVDKEEEERGAGEESCGSSPQKYVLQNLEKIKPNGISNISALGFGWKI